MLDYLRKRAGSWVIKVLFGLLILSFGIWGIGDIFRGPGSADVVASVGDVKITARELTEAYRRDISQFESVFGEQFRTNDVLRQNILQQSLSRLVTIAALEEGARDLGLDVSEAALVRTVRQDPSFTDETETFDRSRFESVLYNNGFTEARYLQLLRGDMIRAQLVDSLTAGIDTPQAIADLLYRYRNEQRTAEAITFTAAGITDVPAPEEADLVALHKDNGAAFTAPEYRALTLVRISAKDLVDEIAVPEERLRDAYQSGAEEFQLPERRDVTQILSADEATAKAVYARVQAGESLETVAAAIAGVEIVPLGLITRDDLPVPALAEAGFSLFAGQVGPPVESPFGWHVLRVERIEPPRQVTFEEARKSLHQAAADELAIDQVFDLVNRLEDELAGGSTIEEAGRELALTLDTVGAVDSNGLAKDGSPVEGLAGQAEVLSAAFTTPAGEQSNLIETSDSNFVILRVDSLTAPALRSFGEVRAQVVEDWTRLRQREIARNRADTALARAKGGEGLSALAGEHGLQIEAIGPVSRAGQAERQVPSGLVGPLFDLKPGDATMAETAEGFMVARLSEVRPATPSAKPDDVTQFRAGFRQALANDIQVQFYTALRRDLGMTVNNRVLESLIP